MPLVRKKTDRAGAANGSKRARIAPATSIILVMCVRRNAHTNKIVFSATGVRPGCTLVAYDES